MYRQSVMDIWLSAYFVTFSHHCYAGNFIREQTRWFLCLTLAKQKSSHKRHRWTKYPNMFLQSFSVCYQIVFRMAKTWLCVLTGKLDACTGVGTGSVFVRQAWNASRVRLEFKLQGTCCSEFSFPIFFSWGC